MTTEGYHRFSFMFGRWGWGEGCSAATCNFNFRCHLILHTEPLSLHEDTRSVTSYQSILGQCCLSSSGHGGCGPCMRTQILGFDSLEVVLPFTCFRFCSVQCYKVLSALNCPTFIWAWQGLVVQPAADVPPHLQTIGGCLCWMQALNPLLWFEMSKYWWSEKGIGAF